MRIENVALFPSVGNREHFCYIWDMDQKTPKTIEQYAVIAVCEIRTSKVNGVVETRYSEPFKFVDTVEEAETIIQYEKNESILHRKCAYQKWTMGQFAEYMRQQFEYVHSVISNHNL